MQLLRSSVLVSALALLACGDDVKWTQSAGSVGDSTYRVLDYDVTSERYRQWVAAHRALDGVEIGEPVSVDLRNLRDEDIERVTQSLETHAAARTAIEGVGMRVEDFVLTTIALAQPWAEENPAVAATIDVADPGPSVEQHASTAPRVRDHPSRMQSFYRGWDRAGKKHKPKKKD